MGRADANSLNHPVSFFELGMRYSLPSKACLVAALYFSILMLANNGWKKFRALLLPVVQVIPLALTKVSFRF
jgi:hypothetical protein